MLPTLRQRGFLLLAIGLAGLLWAAPESMLLAPAESSGIVLWQSRAGALPSLMICAIVAVLAMAPALAAAATGNPVSGPLVFGCSLAVLAIRGGSIDGFMHRSELPGGFLLLAGEAVFWLAGLLTLLWALQRWREPLRSALPESLRQPHFDRKAFFGLPDRESMLAAGICLLVAGFVCFLLLQSHSTGQVVGSLVLGFALGGLCGRLFVRQTNLAPMLATPLVLAVLTFVYLAFTGGGSSDAVLSRWYAGDLLRWANALPIHYASAGVAGCAVGIGFAQALIAGSHEARQAGRSDGADADGQGEAQPTGGGD